MIDYIYIHACTELLQRQLQSAVSLASGIGWHPTSLSQANTFFNIIIISFYFTFAAVVHYSISKLLVLNRSMIYIHMYKVKQTYLLVEVAIIYQRSQQ
jgi:hypothetical protein